MRDEGDFWELTKSYERLYNFSKVIKGYEEKMKL